MPVNAQDFIYAFPYRMKLFEKLDKGPNKALVKTEENIEALLSLVRQEARREALKEMDEARDELDIAESGSTLAVNSRKRAQMQVAALRQEYQQPN